MPLSKPIGLALLLTLAPLASQAAPSTSRGQISVAQVMELIDKAPATPEAAQLLSAYLAGVGETAGILMAAVGPDGKPYVVCQRATGLSSQSVEAALSAAAPNEQKWVETPATPILVADLVKQAGCK